VKPGRWLVTTASTDDDDDDDDDDDEPSWSCRWCRLTWVADA
jgi:hypothetical protein